MVTNRHFPLSKITVPSEIAVYQGVTTAAGAGAGNSIIDANLIGANDFLAGKAILLRSGISIFEVQPVSAFNAVTGEVTVSTAFSAQVTAGTAFSVIDFVTVPPVTYPIIDVWSLYTAQIQLTTPAGNIALPSLTIAGIPTGATVLRVIALVKFRNIENTDAAPNFVSGAQSIQVQKNVAGVYINAIDLAGGEFLVPATTREGGDIMIGTNDVTNQTPANGAQMDFRWTASLANAATLDFNDIQTGVRIYVRL